MKKIFLFLLLITNLTYAENLSEIIKIAYKNHPKLKAIEEKLKALKARETFETSLPDPVVNFSINDIQIFYKPFARDLEPMQTINIGISQKIPYLPKLRLKSLIIKTIYDKTYYKLKAEKQEIIYQIYKNLYLYWQIKEKLKIINEYKEIARQLIGFSNTLYSVGRVSQAEVFNANVFYSELLQKEVFLKGRLKQIKANLRYYANLKPDTSNISLPTPREISGLNTFIETMKNNNPELMFVNISIEEAKKKVKLAELDYKPDFTVFGSYSYRDVYRDYISFGISFNIPIWAKKRQDKKVLEETDLKLEKIKIYKDKYNLLKSKLEENFFKAKTAYENYKIFSQLLKPQTEKVYESILSEYQVGEKNIFDVLKALKQILTVKLKLIDEIVNFHIAYKTIEKLAGVIK